MHIKKFPRAQTLSRKMQTTYPLNVQAIRSQGKQPRLFVTFPLALATAIGLNPGDHVQWELLNRGELHLVRTPSPQKQTAGTAIIVYGTAGMPKSPLISARQPGATPVFSRLRAFGTSSSQVAASLMQRRPTSVSTVSSCSFLEG